jgi:hypothetical protein
MISEPISPDHSGSEVNLARYTLKQVPAQRLEATPRSSTSQRRLIRGEFIKAIPLQWLTPAAASPGKTLAVALAVWFQFGRSKGRPFKLTSAILKRFSVSRKASYHGLKELEKIGLITVQRQKGKNPIVTVLDVTTTEVC